MNVGAVLRGARQRAELSREQLAEQTGLALDTIEALEDDDSDRFVSPDETLDAVRAYAGAVEVDADAIVDGLSTEYPSGPETYVVSAHEIDAFPEEGVFAREGQVHHTVGDFPHDIADFSHHPQGSLLAAVPEPDLDTIDRARADEAAAAAHAAYTSRQFTHSSRHFLGPSRRVPRSRAPAIALITVTLLAAVAFGAYMYTVTRPLPAARSVPSDVVPDAAAPGSPPSGAAPRASTPAELSPRAPASRPPARSTTGATAPPASARASGTAADTTPAVPLGVAKSEADPPPPTRAPSRDVTGRWNFATHVEATSYANFNRMRLGYQIELEQRGNRIAGTGWKVTENGSSIAAPSQTPILIAGTIEGNMVRLNFTERGTDRASEGKFVLYVEEDGSMRGRFSSDAAGSSGTVEARR